MRKDNTLIKKILEVLHQDDNIFVELKDAAFGGYTPKDIIKQMLLMIDGHLVVVGEPAGGTGCYPLKVRISWQGCEWLEKN
jgi:hypothetical protein